MSAFAMGQANQDNEMMVFDWDTAAQRIKETKAENAAAGLNRDWEYTGGPILRNGLPVPRGETSVFLASTWAKPELELDGVREDCYKMASQVPDWDQDTYWPESALAILNS
jgi:hypothetical protein